MRITYTDERGKGLGREHHNVAGSEVLSAPTGLLWLGQGMALISGMGFVLSVVMPVGFAAHVALAGLTWGGVPVGLGVLRAGWRRLYEHVDTLGAGLHSAPGRSTKRRRPWRSLL